MRADDGSAESMHPDADRVPCGELAARPRVIAAADTNEVMVEQLQYLIEHAGRGICGCPQCERYLRARALLMEIFRDASSFWESVQTPEVRSIVPYVGGGTALDCSVK